MNDGDRDRISDRWLWDIARELHRESANGTANGLHIYFELKRVRDAGIRHVREVITALAEGKRNVH